MKDLTLTSFVYRSVNEIPAQIWTGIFPSVLENYSFYKTMEKTFAREYEFYYLAIYRADQLVCLLPAFVTQFTIDTTMKGALKKFAVRLRKKFPRWFTLKVFICGSPLSAGKIGVTEHDQPAIARFLSETIGSLTQKNKINIFAFKDFSPTATRFLDELLAHGFHKINGFPAVELPINFSSLEEYFASLSKATRKSLKRKFNKIKDQRPLDFEVKNNIQNCIDEVYQLYLNTLQKSDIQFEVLPKSFFENISVHMPEETKYFLWKLDGKLVAFDLCLAAQDRMIDEYIGLDYSIAYDYHLYFRTFRDIIQWCLNNGIRIYEGGALNYEPKKNLDFIFIPQYIYVKHRNPVLNIFIGLLAKFLKPENFDPVLKSMQQKSPQKENLPQALTLGVFSLVILTDVIESVAELFYKKAALSTGIDNITLSNFMPFVLKIVGQGNIWIGISLYVFNFFLWITALSKAELSVVYPIGSTSYILVPLLSMIFLHEHINPLRWLGIAVIIAGIYFIFQSTNNQPKLIDD